MDDQLLRSPIRLPSVVIKPIRSLYRSSWASAAVYNETCNDSKTKVINTIQHKIVRVRFCERYNYKDIE